MKLKEQLSEDTPTESGEPSAESGAALLRRVARLAWPAVLESFFIALAGMIDTLMVSGMGSAAVAAVGLTTQPKFLGLAAFFAMNIAVSAVVARRKGQHDDAGANETLAESALLATALGLVISLLCVILAPDIIRLCGSNEDTHDMAVTYFRIIMGGMLFNVLTMVINAAQRGCGNTKIAMTSNLVSSLVNILGNYLLIGGNCGFPALGITGAALATVFGTVVSLVLCVISLCRRDSFLSLPRIWRERMWRRFGAIKIILKLSESTFVEQVLMRIGFMATAVMAADMGTDAFAAHQVGMNALGLSFSFGDGMQSAAVSLIGQSLGERRPQYAKRCGLTCEKIGLAMAICMSLFYLLCSKWLFGLFFEEESIVRIGVGISRIIMVTVLFQICQVIFTGSLRGAGDVVYTMITAALSVTLVRSLVSYVCCYSIGWGIYGIWCGVVADQFCRLILSGMRFKGGKWMRIDI